MTAITYVNLHLLCPRTAMVEHYENEIFSILSSARARTSVILAGKCGSRRHAFFYEFYRDCRSGGNELSNEGSFSIL